MIEVTIGQAVEFLPALKNVMATKLPVKAAYRLARIAAKLQPELKTFDEARFSVFQELGREVPDMPGSYDPPSDPDKLAELVKRVSELTSEKVAIDLDPVTLDMLGDSQLTAADLLALEKVIA